MSNQNRFQKITVWASLAILSAFLVLILHCRTDLIFDGETPLNLSTWKIILTDSGSALSLIDILLAWYAILILMQRLWARDSRIHWSLAAFCFVLSLVFFISKSFQQYDTAVLFYRCKQQFFIVFVSICGYTSLLYCLIQAFYLFLDGNHREAADKNSCKLVFGISFLIVFASWLPWLFAAYPCSLCIDAKRQLGQFFGTADGWTALHPPLSTFIMGAMVQAGGWLNDYSFGAFLYCLLQTVCGAAVISYGAYKLREYGLRTGCCYAIPLFFAIFPLFGNFAQWFEKDLLYSEAVLWNFLLFTDIFHKQSCSKKQAIWFFFSGLSASLLRNNAFYAFAPAIVLFILYLKGHDRKRFIISGASLFLAVWVCSNAVYPALGIRPGSVAESLSIPFQQTARYVRDHGDQVTAEEAEAIDAVLDYENLPSLYMPDVSDPVKASYKEDPSKLMPYFSTWFQMLLKKPKTYAAAFISNSAGFFGPVAIHTEVTIDVGEYSSYSNPDANHSQPYYAISDTVILNRAAHEKNADQLNHYTNFWYKTPILQLFCMPGFYTWIILALGFYLLTRKTIPMLLLLVPSVMNILGCIASPLSNSLRYQLSVILCIPFLIGIVMLSGRSQCKQ